MLSLHRRLVSSCLLLLLLCCPALARMGSSGSNSDNNHHHGHQQHRKLKKGVLGTAMEGEYFVIFERSVPVNQMRQELKKMTDGLVNPTGQKLKIKQQFRLGLHGFYTTDMTQELLLLLLDSDKIQAVEEVVEIAAVTAATPYWNLDRIDQVVGYPLDGNYHTNPLYEGENVDLYIFDTGVFGVASAPGNTPTDSGFFVHPDFAGRYQDCIIFTNEDPTSECIVVDAAVAHGAHVGKLL